jgi:hypothetical protein
MQRKSDTESIESDKNLYKKAQNPLFNSIDQNNIERK